jgi:hypothetical protein
VTAGVAAAGHTIGNVASLRLVVDRLALDGYTVITGASRAVSSSTGSPGVSARSLASTSRPSNSYLRGSSGMVLLRAGVPCPWRDDF